MDGADQGTKLIDVEILQLIDREQQAATAVGACFPGRDEQVGDVIGQDARVCRAGDRIDVERDSRPIGELVRE